MKITVRSIGLAVLMGVAIGGSIVLPGTALPIAPLVVPKSVADAAQESKAAIENRDDDTQKAIWRAVIKREPKNARAYLELGKLLDHPENSKEAIQMYRKAIELDSTLVDGYLALGRLLPSNRDNEASEPIKLYRQATKRAHPNAEIYYQLGETLSDRYGKRVITTAQKDEAIAAFRKAIELDPQQGRFHLLLGAQLWERGEGDAGNEAFQAGMTLNYMPAYKAYSAALNGQNRLSEMVPIYQKAIKQNPSKAHLIELSTHLGEVLETLNRFNEAEVLYRQILVINPDSDMDCFCGSDAWRGHRWRMQGNLDMAVNALQRSIVTYPNFAYAHGELGKTLQQQGKFKEAAAAYTQARSLNKDESYLNELNQVEMLLKGEKSQ